MNTPAEKVGRIVSICFAAVNAVTFILMLSGFLRVRAQFATIFKDLLEGASLPTITVWFLAISPTVLTVVALILLVLLIAKEWLRPAWIPMFLNAFWMALGAALCFLFAVAMMLPLLNIIVSLNK